MQNVSKTKSISMLPKQIQLISMDFQVCTCEHRSFKG